MLKKILAGVNVFIFFAFPVSVIFLYPSRHCYSWGNQGGKKKGQTFGKSLALENLKKETCSLLTSGLFMKGGDGCWKREVELGTQDCDA